MFGTCENINGFDSCSYNSSAPNYQTTITATGQQINNGEIVYDLSKLEDNSQNRRMIGVSTKKDGNYISFGGMVIYIRYVNPDEFLDRIDEYNIDNALDLVKGISKKTSVATFLDNISVADNGTIQVFQDDNPVDASANIGTGMRVVVLDEYSSPVLEFQASVKGDLSGDGDITVTDLVKSKRHLAGLQEVKGAYATAGDITESGAITITDVVKISRDVAGLEEIQ